MKDKRLCLMYHIAEWFATYGGPDALVPDWCFLSWPVEEMEFEELIRLYEEDTGRKVTDMPLNIERRRDDRES